MKKITALVICFIFITINAQEIPDDPEIASSQDEDAALFTHLAFGAGDVGVAGEFGFGYIGDIGMLTFRWNGQDDIDILGNPDDWTAEWSIIYSYPLRGDYAGVSAGAGLGVVRGNKWIYDDSLGYNVEETYTTLGLALGAKAYVNLFLGLQLTLLFNANINSEISYYAVTGGLSLEISID